VEGAQPEKQADLPVWAFDLVALIACFAAWWPAWMLTRDLEWPSEIDFFRDMGAAQSILDGQGGADPAYLFERWWYGPLVPALVGGLSRALDMPLARAFATLGTHLNLAAPIAFYAMMAVFATPCGGSAPALTGASPEGGPTPAAPPGRRAALAALLGFLFFGPRVHPSWLHATYSPWIWPCNFAQALFYSSALFLVWTLRRRSAPASIATGVFIGLLLLAHPGPTAILAVAALVVAGGDVRLWFQRRKAPTSTVMVPDGSVSPRRDVSNGRGSAHRTLVLFAIAGSVGALVAWPFLGDVLAHLLRGVRNPTPMEWRPFELEIQYLPRLVRWHGTLRGFVALVGLVDLICVATAYCRYARRLVLGWGIAVGIGLAHGYAAQLVTLPPFVPSLHFYLYLHALESVLFGLGVVSATRMLAAVAHKFSKLARFSPRSLELGAYSVFAGALIVYAASQYDRYRSRMELVYFRHEAIAFAGKRTAPLYDWILHHTDPTDVFLAEEEPALFAVVAAGRKVVALEGMFSNPYVDVAGRVGDSRAMFAKLKEGRWSEFLVYVKRYQLRYVTLPVAERQSIDERNGAALRRVFASTGTEGWDVYDLVDGAKSAGVVPTL